MRKEQLENLESLLYIATKTLEIQSERILESSEKKNEDIANTAIDIYTQELMDAGLL